MKKIVRFLLLFILVFILVPSVVNADTREIEGITYSRVDVDYTLNDNDYYYMYSIISPRKFIIYNENTDSYNYFENDAYLENEPTSAEIIESYANMWYYDGRNTYSYNDEYEILKENYADEDDLSSGYCYSFNTDLTAQDGITYYSIEYDPYTVSPISEFDENNAHNYFVRAECVEESVVFRLTEDQIVILENLVDILNEKNTNIYADKYNVSMRYFPVSFGSKYINVFQTRYTNTDIDIDEVPYAEYEYAYKFYDLDGNEFDELDNYNYLIYMDKSNLIVAEDETAMYILDLNFNVIFTYDELDYDYYLFDVDDNRLLIDYEYGEAEMITRYVVTEGEDQTYGGEDLSLRISGEMSLFDKVYVNDDELSTDDYAVSEGSTIITLKDAYLKELADGSYTLTATYTDGGVASTTFVVNNAILNPNTSDTLISTLVIGIISLMTIIGLSLVTNKKKFN